MLFKDDPSFQEYSALSADTFQELKTTLENVENKHLVPKLGKEQYKELNDAFTALETDSELPERLELLLDLSRKIVAPWVAVYFTPKSAVKVSGAGARRAETENLKTSYQYQTKDFIAANREEAMDAEEVLLSFLDEKVTDYPLWRDGEGNAAYKKLLIKSAKEFNELFYTPAPHSNFWSVKSKMVDIEELTIPRAVGYEIFLSLKVKVLASTALNDTEKKLLFAIKKAIAAFSISESLPFVHIRMNEEGLTSAGGNFGTNDSYTSRTPATENAIQFFQESVRDTGRNWLAEAKKIIVQDPVTFPPTVPVEASSSKPRKTVFGL